jgi:signal transduction histidine kinase
LEISVKDTGIGIAKSDLDRIFLPFVQADGSITRQYGGTGLGLAITDKLTKLLSGRISVKSEVGKGSEFILSFKIKQPDKA